MRTSGINSVLSAYAEMGDAGSANFDGNTVTVSRPNLAFAAQLVASQPGLTVLRVNVVVARTSDAADAGTQITAVIAVGKPEQILDLSNSFANSEDRSNAAIALVALTTQIHTA